MSRLLLKARPTAAQLADRLRSPRPDGLELYLDTADLADPAAMDVAVSNLASYDLPASFDLLIEGPIRSLDGEFFDLSRNSEADREVVTRLAGLAERLRARAVNVHLIAPTSVAADLTLHARQRLLEASLDLARFFARQILAVGAVPTIENMPPVLRMREARFFYSPIGLPAEDLVWVCERVPGLRATLDLSHAGLYVNCRAYAAGPARPLDVEDDFADLFGFVRSLPPCPDVLAYACALGDHLLTAHVSNASGLLGEGAAYAAGDLDLDRLVTKLASTVKWFVTETLEVDNDRAIEMRRAVDAMRSALRAPRPERSAPCR